MGRYCVKRYKTKRRTRDFDLIYDDLSSKGSIVKLKNQPLDENRPGLGQYYCIECAKYFESQFALDHHSKSKVHKRRMKELKQRPYTTLEAEAASGLNYEKFTQHVAKYEHLEEFKANNREDFEALKGQRNRNLDEIIVGAERAIPKTSLSPPSIKNTNNEGEMT